VTQNGAYFGDTVLDSRCCRISQNRYSRNWSVQQIRATSCRVACWFLPSSRAIRAGPRGGRLHNERIRAMRERILFSVCCAWLCSRSAMLVRLCSRSCRPNSFACCQEFNCLSPMASVSLVQTSPPRSEPFLGVYCGRLCWRIRSWQIDWDLDPAVLCL